MVEVTLLPTDGLYPFIQSINQNQDNIKWLLCFPSSRCEEIGPHLFHFSSDVTLVRIEDFVVPLNATSSLRTPNQVNTHTTCSLVSIMEEGRGGGVVAAHRS